MDELEVDLMPDAAEAEGMRLQPLADGALEVDLDPQEQAPAQAPDADNLAEKMSDQDLARLGQRIAELVEVDLEARKHWVEKFQKGLEACALIGDGPAANMEGGAVVVHPLIAEAAVQFQARAIEEIFPPAGPVKGQVVGPPSQELDQRAERIEAHMNWQMSEEDEQFFWDVDQMLLVLALAGSAFKKTYWDEEEQILAGRFIGAEDVIVPYKAKSLAKSPRVTHRIYLNQYEMQALQESNFYLPQERLKLQRPNTIEASEIKDLADGAEESTDPDEDGEYTIYETSCRWNLPGIDDPKGLPKPYLISVDKESLKVLSIRRNYDEVNGKLVRRTHFTHYKYLPGLGFYGFGLLHYIGGLGQGATDALRALFDAASFANYRGGFKTKEAKIAGKDLTLKYGVWKDVDLTAEEIQKGFYTPDFKEPSPAIVKVFELLVQAGQRFASTTESMVGEGNANIPVGTTIARIEQASKVYSGIHKRLHKAAQSEFRLRAKLNYEHMDDQVEFTLRGSNIVIFREDYGPEVDVIPVSDPNIVSTAQRIAMAQAQLELARQNPAGFNVPEAERRYLEALRVPDIDALMVDPSKIPALDPVSEGAQAMVGQAIKVYPEQNHQAHIAVHMGQVQMLAGSPAEQVATPLLMAHINAHMAAQYRIEMSIKLGIPIPDPAMAQQQGMPPEIQEAVGMAAAQAIAAEQPQGGQEQPPDPESLLKLAQVDKTKAETDEIEIRTRMARGDLIPDDETADIQKALKPLLDTLTKLQAELDPIIKDNEQRSELERLESEVNGTATPGQAVTTFEQIRADLESQIKSLETKVLEAVSKRPMINLDVKRDGSGRMAGIRSAE